MVSFAKIIKTLDIFEIIHKLSELEKAEMMKRIEGLDIYPFSDYEAVISTLLGLRKNVFRRIGSDERSLFIEKYSFR
ncbi:hypothetical protein AGMMS50249_6450 [candidate division SR1 bacterium]|nr:hypothetical protein AGMMS50249_6450 [candidate division SR1 bacterium]